RLELRKVTLVTPSQGIGRYWGFALLALILATTAIFLCPPATPAKEIPAVGVPSHGENALEFLGRSDQDGLAVTHYGYFTHIFGLADAELFSNPANRTEATARFTFSATTTLNARHELGNIIVTTAPGTLTIYFNETPGADFNQPASFANGHPIATFSVRYHNVLNTQGPNEGIISAAVELVQLSASPFTLNERHHRLGRHGLRERIRASGQGTRTQVDPVRAFFLLGGEATIADRKVLR
ncbi:MAG TPA: hypothetical protein VJM10_00155, partial [Candidatus Methylomirabilis sp.]|nr:hypothetical protein [Candidatus Methylomirabilis sp.]